MSLNERLRDFAGALAIASTDAPDNYPAWSYNTYENNMADLRACWADIRPKLKRDADKVEFIDRMLQEAFAAFDNKDKETGSRAIFAIYNLGVKGLR